MRLSIIFFVFISALGSKLINVKDAKQTTYPNIEEKLEIKDEKKLNEPIKTVSTNNYDEMFNGLVYSEDIEEYDYFELLEWEITPFMNWLESLFDLDDINDMNFVTMNFNKLMIKAIHDGIISDVFNKPTPLYAGSSHNQLMTDSLNLLLKDNKNAVYNFFNSYSSILHSASKAPDTDEQHAGTHYYEYGSEQKDGYYTNSYIDKNYSISARTRFEEHYSTAINAYKNNKISVAIDELGRAIHYIGDVSCTPHSSGFRDDSFLGSISKHVMYENWLKLVYKSNSIYVASSADDYYDEILVLDNPGSILNDVASFSSKYKENIQERGKDTTDVNYAPYVEVARECLPYAQQIIAAILNRFYEDVTNPLRKINYIKDGAIYFIKNVGTGKYIDVKSWSTDNDAVTHSYLFHGDKNQQFRAEIQSDGSFKFTPMHALDKKLHISRIITTMERLNITGVGHKFKPVYHKNGTFRFIPEYDTVGNTPTARYYKYPLAQVDDVIRVRTTEVWDPTDSNYYWKFEEAPTLSLGEKEFYLGKNEIKKVLITVSQQGIYDIETVGDVNTYFVNLKYRVGEGNTNIYDVILVPNDDSGEGTNAKYSDVELLPNRVYILFLRGTYSSSTGNVTIKLSGSGPLSLETEKLIRTTKYEINDSGRFKNSYDEINFYNLFGENVSSLKAKGYTKVVMTVEFYAYEVNDGYQYFWIYNGTSDTSKNLYGKEFEHKPGSKDGNARKYIYNDIEFNLSDVISNSVYVRYGAAGSGEDNWVNYNLKVSIRVY